MSTKENQREQRAATGLVNSNDGFLYCKKKIWCSADRGDLFGIRQSGEQVF